MKRLALLIALATGFGPLSAHAAQPVGLTIDAAAQVTGAGPGGNRTIVKDSPIFMDDRLTATATGNAQIILVDKTRIVVGPGARVDIDAAGGSGRHLA